MTVTKFDSAKLCCRGRVEPSSNAEWIIGMKMNASSYFLKVENCIVRSLKNTM